MNPLAAVEALVRGGAVVSVADFDGEVLIAPEPVCWFAQTQDGFKFLHAGADQEHYASELEWSQAPDGSLVARCRASEVVITLARLADPVVRGRLAAWVSGVEAGSLPRDAITFEPPLVSQEELASARTQRLLSLHGVVLQELRLRKILRTGNAPAGDYAELLLMIALGGKLAPKVEKSWDVDSPTHGYIQVKSRVVLDPRNNSQRQLSALRSFSFRYLAVVLFGPGFEIRSAALLPVLTVLRAKKFYKPWERAYALYADDHLMAQNVEAGLAERLRDAACQLDFIPVQRKGES
ncbi:MAG TPA: hypothetical protein VMW62_16200 [Chloroflexota bacterium]|nr:hypothetical protein [Chloroflexota bacterium]